MVETGSMALFKRRKELKQVEEEGLEFAILLVIGHLKAILASESAKMEGDAQREFVSEMTVIAVEHWSFEEGAFCLDGIPITRPENHDEFGDLIMAITGVEIAARYREHPAAALEPVVMRIAKRFVEQVPKIARDVGFPI